jgi:hypothetical protein
VFIDSKVCRSDGACTGLNTKGCPAKLTVHEPAETATLCASRAAAPLGKDRPSHYSADIVAIHVFAQRANLAVIDFDHPRINVVVRRSAFQAADAAGFRRD